MPGGGGFASRVLREVVWVSNPAATAAGLKILTAWPQIYADYRQKKKITYSKSPPKPYFNYWNLIRENSRLFAAKTFDVLLSYHVRFGQFVVPGLGLFIP